MKNISPETLQEVRERFADQAYEYARDARGDVGNMALYTEDEWCDGKVDEDVLDYLAEEAVKHLSSIKECYPKDPGQETYDRLMKIAYVAEKANLFDDMIHCLDNAVYEASMKYYLERSKRDLRDIKLIAPEFNEILEAY